MLCLRDVYASDNALRYKVSAKSQAEFRDSRYVSARIWSLVPRLKLIYELDTDFKFYLDTKVLLETGSNDSLYIDEYRPRREIIIQDGKFQKKLFDFVEISVGAINQGIFKSPLFLDQTAFAGISERAYIVFSGFEVYFNLQQMIPNNQTLSARLGGTDEGTPKFFSETLGLDFRNKIVHFNLEYTLFAFENLSRSVAHQSRFLGNQVVGTGQENASFVYPFKGHNTMMSLLLKFDSFGFQFNGHYTHNNESPNSRADAYLAQTKLLIANFEIGGFLYSSQTDAAPAYYNDKFFGHNNSEGQGALFVYHFNNYSYRIRTRYIKGQLIENSLYQDDFTGTQLDVAKSF